MPGEFRLILSIPKETREFFEKAPAKLNKEIKLGLRAVAQELRDNIKLGITKGGRSGLHVRSGRLRSSIQTVVTTEPLTARVKVGGRAGGGTTVEYAALHEFGGKIKSKRGKWLTIPLKKARTKAGVTRAPTTSFTDTFVNRSKKGNLIVFRARETKGGKKRLDPLFVLKKRVKIPVRPFIAPEVKKIRDRMPAIIAPFLQRAIE